MTPIKLILLPGLDDTGELFAPLLKALPDYIEPIVIPYPAQQPMGYDALLPHVLAALPADTPFVLLGESFGGPLSLRVAAARPANLKALILCATFVTCPHHYVPRWADRLVLDFPFRFFPLLSRAKGMLGGYASPAWVQLTQTALKRVAPTVFAQRIREVVRVDVSAELVECPLPILYIQGKQDLVVPAGNFERIRAIKPTVRLTSIPTHHMVLQTQPALAAEAIAVFIREVMHDRHV
jgi:pimeloyl-ACP methyl ester carboxylesterase